ncbi:unnamed protein product [Periconia digitata]|uniref:Uncharacterized protein n=1 Tax=Periconia digitata TaxID=1303443 RepID=A0A9W4UQI6_9PLEO|nr:unnamed protein product [Periconia digitata]
MSKPRKTPVLPPGSAPKKTVNSSKNALSQEFVSSSDDSASETEARPQKKTPVQIAVHRPKSGVTASETKKSKKGKEEAPKSSAKSKQSPKKPSPKKPVPKQVTTEEDGTTTSSSDDSEDEPETDIRKAQDREKQKAASTSTSDSSSDDSSDESEADTPAATSKATPTQPRSAPTNIHDVEMVAASAYVPPRGFNQASTSRAASLPSTTLLSNLQGKQIWHLTAPANISLKDLQQLAMDQATKGKAVLKHKNASYGFSDVAEEDGGSQQVIIPRQNGYKPVSSRISHSFHLREIVDLPKLSSHQADPNTGSEAAASITMSTIRAPLPQVKGLKMRFFPSGAKDRTPVTLGSSDDEDEPEQAPTAGLAVPNGVHSKARSEKRKHADMNEDDRAVKKLKKHRTPEELKRREERRAKKEKKREKAKS